MSSSVEFGSVQIERSGHLHDHGNASVFAKRPILTGIAVGVGSLAPHFFLPAGIAQLCGGIDRVIAGIYFGFAVMNGSGRDQFVEFNVTGLFTVVRCSACCCGRSCFRWPISAMRCGTSRTITSRAWRWYRSRNGMFRGAS